MLLIPAILSHWSVVSRPLRLIYIQETEYGSRCRLAESIGLVLWSIVTGGSSIAVVFKGVHGKQQTAELTVQPQGVNSLYLGR